MAVNINVPSQVKTYANLAAFPASGALKTIYIAEDTNKTYRWTGSVYVEVSAAGASGITIGTTAITSGTVGRVLFEGTGNVVQESANLFWDNTNVRLGIGTSTAPSGSVYIDNSGNDVKQHLILKNSDAGSSAQVHLDLHNNSSGSAYSSGASLFLCSTTAASPYASALGFWNYQSGPIALATSSIERMRVSANGNVLINTTTDAGFKLDINGTARVSGDLTFSSSNYIYFNGTAFGSYINSNGYEMWYNSRQAGKHHRFLVGGVETCRIQYNSSSDIRLSVGGVLGFPSAIISADSTTQGFLPPRLTTTQKNAIATPATGLMVYDNVLNRPCFYDGATWITL